MAGSPPNRLLRGRPYLVAGVAIALIIALLFGGRAAWRLGHRLAGPPPPPRQTDVSQIADWMSVPYVSRAYRVPESELYRALGVEPEGRRVHSLRDLARDTGRSSDEVVEVVRETVSAWQAEHPGRPGPPGRGEPDAKPRSSREPPTGPPRSWA
jgi:hypothetical protein